MLRPESNGVFTSSRRVKHERHRKPWFRPEWETFLVLLDLINRPRVMALGLVLDELNVARRIGCGFLGLDSPTEKRLKSF